MNQKAIRFAVVLMLVLAIGSSGCGNEDAKAANAAAFGIGGAAVGAGVGSLVAGKGNRTKGALIGGAVGAAGGALLGYQVGKSVEKEKKKYASEEAFLRRQVADARADRQRIQGENEALRDEVQQLRRKYDEAVASNQRDEVTSQIKRRVEELEKEQKAAEARLAFYKESLSQADKSKNGALAEQLQREIGDLERERDALQARRDSMARIVTG